MPLVPPAHHLTDEALRLLTFGLLEELKELREELDQLRELDPATTSRLWTIRGLLEDAERIATARPIAELDNRERATLANLLYDVTLVGAEYYKLYFARPGTPTPTPPIRATRA
ncbi:MAG: hypothetical protein L3K13_06890 [Thermoplasmata archaeon]|nr:hypothetical protein [Thermoplasmata archaeon]